VQQLFEARTLAGVSVGSARLFQIRNRLDCSDEERPMSTEEVRPLYSRVR